MLSFFRNAIENIYSGIAQSNIQISKLASWYFFILFFLHLMDIIWRKLNFAIGEISIFDEKLIGDQQLLLNLERI